MRNLLLGLAIIGILSSTVGCANGPIRQWLRGAPCNTCNPALGQPTGENLLGSCNTGACSTGHCNSGTCSTGATGSGILGGVFRSNQNNNLEAPVSLPASSFDQTPTIGSNSELYGNTNNTGRLELPPSGPYN